MSRRRAVPTDTAGPGLIPRAPAVSPSPHSSEAALPAYYNEHDECAAAWLRELIKAGHVAPGDVDTRSIEEVQPDDLRGYDQHHFFAGIGGWSYALRLAGWPDDRPVWTGSCPCQPFSAAGKRAGTADRRHLWPDWFRLVRECRPLRIIGEQVEGAVRLGWLDLVFGDLEGQGYACGAAVLGAHSVGAPHIRQRLYWVADASTGRRAQGRGLDGESGGARDGLTDDRTDGGVADASSARRIGPLGEPEGEARDEARMRLPGADGPDGRLADADGGLARDGHLQRGGEHGQLAEDGGITDVGAQAWAGGSPAGERGHRSAAISGQKPMSTCRLADPSRERRQQDAGGPSRDEGPDGRGAQGDHVASSAGTDLWSSAPSSFWRDPDWLLCRDGRWRPVESGTFPLVDGAPARVGRLRGYGNAIVPQVAAAFVQAAMTC